MFKNINIYIQATRDERRKHLDLSEPCIKIGGNSFQSRMLLAHYLKTTVPEHRRIYVCHACNDAGCSNVNHLYWGTPKDNHIDRIESGNNKLKIGSVSASPTVKKNAQKMGLRYGGTNALREDELQRIKAVLDSIPKRWGWKTEAAKLLGVSHTQIGRYLNMVPR